MAGKMVIPSCSSLLFNLHRILDVDKEVTTCCRDWWWLSSSLLILRFMLVLVLWCVVLDWCGCCACEDAPSRRTTTISWLLCDPHWTFPIPNLPSHIICSLLSAGLLMCYFVFVIVCAKMHLHRWSDRGWSAPQYNPKNHPKRCKT